MEPPSLALADAARIASLEEEVVLARERARAEGDELESLRSQVRQPSIIALCGV